MALWLAVAAAGCAAGSTLESLPPGDDAEMASAVAERRGPVVQMLPPVAEQLPPLDPDARPTTPLGALRARYFPIWASDFDGAFPPDVCGSAWELDGIAEPVANIDVSLYGDARVMAALAVMRYEHLVSHALASPTPLAQLCVAVGSVDPARAEALERLAARIEESQHSQSNKPEEPSQTSDWDEPGRTGQPSGGATSYPAAVAILASGPSAVLAVACNPVGHNPPSGGTADTAAADQATERAGGARLGAYLLQVARGREDRVVDVSYRVARVQHRSVADCSALDAWASEWDEHVTAWIAEGQAWIPTRVAVSLDDLCSGLVPDGPHDCPLDWTA